MPATYYCLLTRVGEAKLAKATALGTRLAITNMAVGDGGGSVPQPEPAQTALKHEVRRGLVNELKVDPLNANQIIIEQVIPEDAGGWWIREVGAFDADGDLIAVGNCPESYKPVLAEGSGRTQVIRMVLIVSSADAVTLKIDPSVVLATKQHVTETVAKAVSDHLKQPDPHPQYLTEAEGKQRIDAAVAALVAGAPGALDTLKELSDALGGDRNFSATVMGMLAGKLGKTEAAADSAKLGGQLPAYYAKASDLADLSGRSSMPAGVLMPYMGISQPAWGLPLLGGSVSRASYPKLFAVLCPLVTATTAAGSGVVTVPSTLHWYAGMPIEDARFATGTTVVSIDGATTATLSNTAATTGSGQLRVFLFGYGAGGSATTFGLPLGAGDYLRAYDSGRSREKWTLTGNLTSGSNVIAGLASTRGIMIGSTVAHANISGSGVTVTKITANSITLSSTATANVTAAAIVMTGMAIGTEGDDEVKSHTHYVNHGGSSTINWWNGTNYANFGSGYTSPAGGPENNVKRLIVGMYICHGEAI